MSGDITVHESLSPSIACLLAKLVSPLWILSLAALDDALEIFVIYSTATSSIVRWHPVGIFDVCSTFEWLHFLSPTNFGINGDITAHESLPPSIACLLAWWPFVGFVIDCPLLCFEGLSFTRKPTAPFVLGFWLRALRVIRKI